MVKGFFSSSRVSKSPNTYPRIPHCGSCGLYKKCHSPKMPPTGKGKCSILIVAEAPGKKEDRKGIQLIGEAGQELREVLRELNVSLDKDCRKTNAIICRPPKNETPDNDKIECCRPNLLKTIRKYKPNVTILLGGVAVKSLIGTSWKNTGMVKTWVGRQIPSQIYNTWICPTYHPSYLIRQQNDTLRLLFRQHLKRAIKKAKQKPWLSIPQYEREVELLYKPSQAAKTIINIAQQNTPFAFDYECNCLKPEAEYAEIISCSICDGKRTVAFPWNDTVAEAMTKLLINRSGKIASNIKFEDRWTFAKLGVRTRNWLWDTMLAAHTIDNRPNTTSLKFQAFIHLGMENYDDHIKPYLQATKGSHTNRIKELELKDLLVYNGLDSLLEYKIAMIQRKLLQKGK